METEKHFKMGG